MMNVLDILSLATQAAQAAAESYAKADAAVQQMQVAIATQERSVQDLQIATTHQQETEDAVRSARTWLSQQIRATGLAGSMAIKAAEFNHTARAEDFRTAQDLLGTARESAKEARERVDRAVASADRATKIREVIHAASEITDASAYFGGTKEAVFAQAKMVEARAAAEQAAHDAALNADACVREADVVIAIANAAEVWCDAARLASVTADTALSMAQSAQVAISHAIETVHATLGTEA